jgi:hypothetical protein
LKMRFANVAWAFFFWMSPGHDMCLQKERDT